MKLARWRKIKKVPSYKNLYAAIDAHGRPVGIRHVTGTEQWPTPP